MSRGSHAHLSPWIACRTQVNQEWRAAYHIEAQGYRWWMPMFLETVQRSDGRILFVQKFMFPGYVLVECLTGYWSFLTGTRGVASVVMTGEQPSRLSWINYRDLRGLENEDGFVLTPKSTDKFQTNDPVLVSRGALAVEGMRPMRAIYQGRSAKDYVRILLHWLGAVREIDVRERDLDPVVA
jgi:transcription antitermination factor NusG